MEIKRIWERPRLVVVSDDAAESRVLISTTVYEHQSASVQVIIDAGPVSMALYLRSSDLLALSKLFDDAAAAVGG